MQGRAKKFIDSRIVYIDGNSLTIDDVIAVARAQKDVSLSEDPAFYKRISSSAIFLDRLLAKNATVYGVNTGYGDSCSVVVPPQLIPELPLNLTRYHGCGMGDFFAPDAVLAILACRLNSIAKGFSGVRWGLLEQLVTLINYKVLPVIPCEGSVGASGDLTPLSYVAAALIGERDAYHQGKRQATAEVFKAMSITPIKLLPKEALAVMNGTAVMTALACLAWHRADYLSRLCARITAMASVALRGNRDHFDPRLFAVKPHAGQNEVAAWIYHDLAPQAQDSESARLQDRYSIRCAPHIIGVLRDALPWMKRDIENELNSANDNPLIDSDSEMVFHGGHFYGGHIGFVMDAMKNAVANLADLLDRQLALLVDNKFNHGLAQNLSGARSERAAINHGFKAVQIAVSAWTAEALKLTMPASAFSRSTECHNQDKVSMGTIAARDCLRILQLTEQAAAALCLATYQGIQLRLRAKQLTSAQLIPAVREFIDNVAGFFDFVEEDRPLEEDLRTTVNKIQQQEWLLYKQT